MWNFLDKIIYWKYKSVKEIRIIYINLSSCKMNKPTHKFIHQNKRLMIHKPVLGFTMSVFLSRNLWGIYLPPHNYLHCRNKQPTVMITAGLRNLKQVQPQYADRWVTTTGSCQTRACMHSSLHHILTLLKLSEHKEVQSQDQELDKP